jgi:hypothetical protein
VTQPFCSVSVCYHCTRSQIAAAPLPISPRLHGPARQSLYGPFLLLMFCICRRCPLTTLGALAGQLQPGPVPSSACRRCWGGTKSTWQVGCLPGCTAVDCVHACRLAAWSKPACLPACLLLRCFSSPACPPACLPACLLTAPPGLTDVSASTCCFPPLLCAWRFVCCCGCGRIWSLCCDSRVLAHHAFSKASLCPPLLAGEFANGGEVAELLLAAGAKRLSRPPAAPLQGTSGGPCTSFLLCEGPDTASSPAQHRHMHEAGTVCAATCGNAVGPAAVAVPPALAAAKWYRKAAEAGVPVVSHRWLLDTISSYTALPLSAYCL